MGANGTKRPIELTFESGEMIDDGIQKHGKNQKELNDITID